ncbi:MAG: YebC/PmpR family DNA-binding transcriptional regulator, partial [Planctomycetes bacterium]|nr:YebC/PmpR family DNA-binding transcriptional regulator [Planctomycetota bacterium]
LEERGYELEIAEIQKLPQNTIEVTDEDHARKIAKLIETMEDHDDVQNVSSNHSFSEEIEAKIASE